MIFSAANGKVTFDAMATAFAPPVDKDFEYAVRRWQEEQSEFSLAARKVVERIKRAKAEAYRDDDKTDDYIVLDNTPRYEVGDVFAAQATQTLNALAALRDACDESVRDEIDALLKKLVAWQSAAEALAEQNVSVRVYWCRPVKSNVHGHVWVGKGFPISGGRHRMARDLTFILEPEINDPFAAEVAAVKRALASMPTSRCD